MKHLLSNTLSSQAFFMVNKTIAKELSINAAIILAELIFRRDQFTEGEDNEFYTSYKQLSESCFMGRNAVMTAIKSLKDHSMISIKKRGLPATSYYTINEEVILEVLGGTTSRSISGRLVVRNRDDKPSDFGTHNKNNKLRKDTNKLLPRLNTFQKLYAGKDGWSRGTEFKFEQLSEEDQQLLIDYVVQETTDSFIPYTGLVLDMHARGELTLQESLPPGKAS